MLLRRVARPMLAAIFISAGVDTLRRPEGHVQAARPLLAAVSPAVDKAVEAAPIDERPSDETLVKIDAGVKIVAGTMLALGKAPRLAATTLAASLVPTTLAWHRFWEETDPEVRAQQQIHFLKNVGLFGGLLIASADTAGKPSLGWRGRRAAEAAATSIGDAGDRVSELAGGVGESVSGLAGDLGSKAGATVDGATSAVSDRFSGASAPTTSAAKERAAGIAAGLAGFGSGAGAVLSDRAARAGGEFARVGGEVTARGGALSDDWVALARKARKRAEKRAAALQKKANKRAPAVLDQVTTQASKLGHDIAERASAVGHEVAHQAEGIAHDARKRLAAARR